MKYLQYPEQTQPRHLLFAVPVAALVVGHRVALSSSRLFPNCHRHHYVDGRCRRNVFIKFTIEISFEDRRKKAKKEK